MKYPPKADFAGTINMMKSTYKICQIFLLMCGVFGADADEVKSVSVMEGDSVTLHTDPAKIQGFILILWRFGDPVIAQIDGKEISYPSHTEIFRGRLQLNQTGFLTIKNMRIKHSGLYKIEIDHNTGISYKQIFSVTVYESPSVIAEGETTLESVSVTEGDPVTLHVPQIQGDELIVWRFGDEGKLIAKADIEAKSSSLYDETDGRFRDRLKLNDQTGSLTITNIRTPDSGLYTVKISSNKQTSYKRFTVTVIVPGLSGGAVAGIVVVVVLLLAAAVAGVMYYYCRRTSELPKETRSVPAGDYVTLNPDPEIQRGDEIQWLFGDEDTLIAEIKGETREMTTHKGPGMIFMNRLKLDETTGSLTINNIDNEHTGLYTLKTRRGRETFYKKITIFVREMIRSVTEGDPVTLNPDKEIEKGDEIQWLFADKEKQTVIAEIRNTEVTKYDGTDKRFRDGLELNKKTGSLTITDFTAAHAGLYTLKIRKGRETFYKKIYIYEKRKITKMEGESFTLKPAREIKKDDVIQWLFGDERQQTLIAEINGETEMILTYDDVADGRFRDILKLNKTTRSLTIRKTRTEHSGVYKLQIRSSSGVSGQTFIVTVRVEEKLLAEGDSVTLKPDTEIQRDDQILWMFGDQDKLIAQMKGGTVDIYDDVNKRFRGRLKLDKMTGSLTITKIEAEHTGLYKLQIISSSGETLVKRFKVLTQLRYEAVTAGESVHLYTGLTEIQRGNEIQWRFGDENSPIAEIKGGTGKTHDGPDERFRDRLELNEKTGDLIIKNSTAEHAGRYKLKICSSEGKTNRTFTVIIRYALATKEAREKSLLKEKNEKRVNESATVVMPLLDGEDVNVVNEERTSAL